MKDNIEIPSSFPKNPDGQAAFAKKLDELRQQEFLDEENTAKIATEIFTYIFSKEVSDEKIIRGEIEYENNKVGQYIRAINFLINEATNNENGGVKILQAANLTARQIAAGGGVIAGQPLVKVLCGVVNDLLQDKFPHNSPKNFKAQSLAGGNSLENNQPSVVG